MRKSKQWVRTTIKEAFPVLPNQIGHRAEAKGPFYAPGSEWFDTPNMLAFRQWAAEVLRKNGYTVTVELITR